MRFRDVGGRAIAFHPDHGSLEPLPPPTLSHHPGRWVHKRCRQGSMCLCASSTTVYIGSLVRMARCRSGRTVSILRFGSAILHVLAAEVHHQNHHANFAFGFFFIRIPAVSQRARRKSGMRCIQLLDKPLHYFRPSCLSQNTPSSGKLVLHSS